MLHKARFNMLKTFADIFLDYPSLDNVLLLKEFISNIIDTVDKESYLSQGYSALEKNLQNMDNKTFNRETTGLFYTGINAIGRTSSYYLSEKKVNKQDQWEMVLIFYRKHNFYPQNCSLHHEDSIGTQLLFLATTTEKLMVIVDKDKQKDILNIQKSFYSDYLLTWIELFIKTLYNNAPDNGVYKPIALILLGYILIDKDLVFEMVEEI